MMGKRSSVARAGTEVAAIAEVMAHEGKTIDQIVLVIEHVSPVPLSRSAVGRFTRRLDLKYVDRDRAERLLAAAKLRTILGWVPGTKPRVRRRAVVAGLGRG